MRNFVIINGVNSNTINGLGINELPPITKPEMRNIREEIDGRDGDIITDLGYSAYDKTITIGLFGTGYDINDIVAFFNGEGTIVFSNEPDKYYNFKILNQIDYESLQKFRTASITFHCQPFKYPLTETPLEIEYDYIEDEGETLTLNNTADYGMELSLKGNTSQSGTPTPTSPIPVSVVSGDNDIVVCGKNLFNINNIDDALIGANTTYTLSNDEMTVSGRYYIGIKTKVKPNTDYYVSSVIETITASSPGGYIAIYTMTPSWYKNISNGNGTFNSGNNDYLYIALVSGNGTAGTYKFKNVMLVEGTTATSYEPYQSQTYPIDLIGNNLFKGTLYNGIINQGGTYVSNANRITNANSSTMKTFILKKGTYTLSIENIDACTIVIKNESGSVIQEFADSWKTLPYTFTTTNDGYFYFSAKKNIDGALTPSDYKPMLNKGTTALPYEDNWEIELCKIGTYQDYFTKNSEGQWCKYNAIGKVVLDGSENWSTTSSYADYYRISLSINGIISSSENDFNLYSNYFLASFGALTTTQAFVGAMAHYRSSNDVYFVINENSTANFKTWLSLHNTNVYYVLNTPYLSLIEDNNLITQLDNIQNATSYEGTTNISQVNNDKAFIISAKALEDGSNEVVVNNIGNVYSKPLIALEGNGNVDIYLDNTQILQANVESKMNIDIAQLEAYNPDTMTLLNRQVIGNYNSMTLQSGNNTIRIDGALTSATITNYTRYL